MAKLCKYDREAVARKMVVHALQDEYNTLSEAEAKLAAKLFEERYTSAQRATIDNLPKGWLPQIPHFYVHLPAETHAVCLHFGGVQGYGLLASFSKNDGKVQRPAPKNFDSVSISHGDKNLEIVVKHAAAVKDFTKKVTELYAKAEAILASTTIAKLAKAWPEVVPFLPEATRPASVPAIRTEELNKEFKLP